MTFIEVLLGLSLLALILIAGTSLLHSFVRTYFFLESDPPFSNHANGVTGFLDYLALGNMDNTDSPQRSYGWETSPSTKKNALTFSIDQDVPFFISEIRPLPPVKAFLEFDKDNNRFWLVWHTLSGTSGGNPDLHYSLLSPWAEDIEYGYYKEDQKKWEFERASADSRENENTRPQVVYLLFNRGGQQLERRLNLQPEEASNVLTY